jgi:hypothetical protein
MLAESLIGLSEIVYLNLELAAVRMLDGDLPDQLTAWSESNNPADTVNPAMFIHDFHPI